MTQTPLVIFKSPTKSPQPASGKPARPVGRAKAGGPPRNQIRAKGTGRSATRGGGEVVELAGGITVYPAREDGGRWRAVWQESGDRRQCEAASEEKLAAKLEKVSERLAADAPNMIRPGADLIAHYLNLDRLPVDERWSRKHSHTQERLCARFVVPVIETVTCEDIKTAHMQKIVNAAPTPGEGVRLQRMISAMVTAGLDGGYLANPRLAKVHWQAGDRPLPAPRMTVAGESALWIAPGEIPAERNIAELGCALAWIAGRILSRLQRFAWWRSVPWNTRNARVLVTVRSLIGAWLPAVQGGSQPAVRAANLGPWSAPVCSVMETFTAWPAGLNGLA